MTQYSVPNGEFPMGTLMDGEWVDENEMPQHIVYLNGFWIDESEITNSQYALCVQDETCAPPHKNNSYSYSEYYGNPEYDHYPVVQVDWAQAKSYCEWAGRRLPTEAEWEKAARGTSEQTYPWEGENKGEFFANFYVYNVGDTTPVKNYKAGKSPYGAYDMAGNVYEWVADWYSDTYYASSSLYNPTGPETGLARVMRGGAWSSDWVFIRTASRMYYYPEDFSGDIGFRCAQSQ
jgi:formylglycine-generating enzyme required for sulfatase activity